MILLACAQKAEQIDWVDCLTPPVSTLIFLCGLSIGFHYLALFCCGIALKLELFFNLFIIFNVHYFIFYFQVLSQADKVQE